MTEAVNESVGFASRKQGAAERERMAREAVHGKEVIPEIKGDTEPSSPQELIPREEISPAPAEEVTEVKSGAEKLEELMADPDFKRAFNEKARELLGGNAPSQGSGPKPYREAEEGLPHRIYPAIRDLKAFYPEADLRRTLSDRRVQGMVRNGISLREAYEAVNIGRILAEREQRVVANIKARASRPAEGGAVSQSGAVSGNSVSKLTRAEREDLARRAIRGETVRLNV